MNKTQKTIAVLTFFLWATVSLLWGYQKIFQHEPLLYITYSVMLITVFILPDWKMVPAIMAGSMPLTVLGWWSYWGFFDEPNIKHFHSYYPPFDQLGTPGVIVFCVVLPGAVCFLANIFKKKMQPAS